MQNCSVALCMCVFGGDMVMCDEFGSGGRAAFAGADHSQPGISDDAP